jgi:hypothetical protein
MTLPHDDDESEGFDARFRRLFPKSSMSRSEQAYWNSILPNEQIREDEEENPRRRGRAKRFSADGAVDTRMCQTEVALRAGRHLAESPLLAGGVYVQVGGAEVNRVGNDVPEFAVKSHLSRWGFTKDPTRPGGNLPEWIGFYTSRRTKRKLLVNFSKHNAHVMAFLATGQRLIVHCTAGNIGNTRSPAEHHDLHRMVGRAILWPGTKPEDLIAVCTPRSERFRKMTAGRSHVDGVQRSRLIFLHVDRGGGITGLPEA